MTHINPDQMNYSKTTHSLLCGANIQPVLDMLCVAFVDN